MKGINTGSWWKFFIFPAKNTLSLIRNAERHFYSPLRKTFLFFLLIKYLKIKKHSPIQVNALSKFSYFVVYDAYSETLAYLLKCNRPQLYFHVGMGTQSPSSLKPVNNTKLSKWQYCACRTIFLLIYQSPATARYALEMSPSKCCSSKGFFPWTHHLWYMVALFAPILSFWWRFPPPLYDFDGAFCHHFLSSDFIVILFRFQISKNGGAKWSHFWIPGALFAPK